MFHKLIKRVRELEHQVALLELERRTEKQLLNNVIVNMEKAAPKLISKDPPIAYSVSHADLIYLYNRIGRVITL